MAMCAATPRKRKQGLATSPQSEEKKLPAAAAKASKPPATAAGSNQKPHRAQQWQQNAGGPWGRHRYTHMNQDPAAARSCSKCRWASIRDAWRQALPLDPNSSLIVSSWLDAKPLSTPDSAWGVGCKACAWASEHTAAERDLCQSPYVTFTLTGGGGA